MHLKYIESMQQWDIVKAGHRKASFTYPISEYVYARWLHISWCFSHLLQKIVLYPESLIGLPVPRQIMAAWNKTICVL